MLSRTAFKRGDTNIFKKENQNELSTFIKAEETILWPRTFSNILFGVFWPNWWRHNKQMLLFVVSVIKMLWSLYINLQFVDIQSLSWANDTWGNDGRGDPLQHMRTDFLSTTTKGIAPGHRGGLKCWVSGRITNAPWFEGELLEFLHPETRSRDNQIEIWMREF